MFHFINVTTTTHIPFEESSTLEAPLHLSYLESLDEMAQRVESLKIILTELEDELHYYIVVAQGHNLPLDTTVWVYTYAEQYKVNVDEVITVLKREAYKSDQVYDVEFIEYLVKVVSEGYK